MMLKVLGGAAAFCALGYSVIPTYTLKLLQHKRNRNGQKTIFLTFDDGPNPNYTNELLDILKKHRVKASFFVVANFAKENPQIIARMKREGHLIGLHSLEHKNGLWQTPSYTKNDFQNSIKIAKSLGIDVHYYRPPWGCFNATTFSQMNAFKLKPILWDVMAQDWRGDTSVKEIERKLVRRTKEGDIICLHDGRGKNEAPSRTIAALKKVLPYWISLGYRFETVDKYEK